MNNLDIKEVMISEHRLLISEMMRGLHESERRYFDKTAPWEEIAADYMRHVTDMQETCKGTCLVAYAEGQPAGFIFGYVESPDESRIEIDAGDELYISDGYVAPAFRRMGIYQRLNVAIEQKYIRQGIRRITRFTLVNNEPMRQLLAASGYRATRVLYEKWLI